MAFTHIHKSNGFTVWNSNWNWYISSRFFFASPILVCAPQFERLQPPKSQNIQWLPLSVPYDVRTYSIYYTKRSKKRVVWQYFDNGETKKKEENGEREKCREWKPAICSSVNTGQTDWLIHFHYQTNRMWNVKQILFIWYVDLSITSLFCRWMPIHQHFTTINNSLKQQQKNTKTKRIQLSREFPFHS